MKEAPREVDATGGGQSSLIQQLEDEAYEAALKRKQVKRVKDEETHIVLK